MPPWRTAAEGGGQPGEHGSNALWYRGGTDADGLSGALKADPPQHTVKPPPACAAAALQHTTAAVRNQARPALMPSPDCAPVTFQY
jgi:hypothetical protein